MSEPPKTPTTGDYARAADIRPITTEKPTISLSEAIRGETLRETIIRSIREVAAANTAPETHTLSFGATEPPKTAAPAHESAMGSSERNFWINLSLWGGAFLTIFGAGLFALFEDHPYFGAVYTVIGVGGLIYMSLLLKEGKFRPQYVLLGALALTWIFFGYDFWLHYQSPTLQSSAGGELPLPAGSSRLEVWNWELFPEAVNFKGAGGNVHIMNAGQAVTTGFSHIGSLTITDAHTSEDVIAGMFAFLHAQMAVGMPANQPMEIGPGDKDKWFSILGPPNVTNQQKADIASGKLFVYAFTLMRYADATTPPGKFIFTENCIYTAGPVTHLCETGHNRTYVAAQ